MKRVIGALAIAIMGSQAENLVNVDGYLRGTYQAHDVKGDRTYKDDALGGKLHINTAKVDGVSLGVSFYTSNSIINSENRGLVSLRGESHKSYTLLGEAYLKAESKRSLFKIGRQELDTPFADRDDIGMIPNTFEAAIFETKEIENTTIFLGQLQKMAGVDAKEIDRFTKINGSKNMQVLGVTYEGISSLTLAGWYYNLKGAEVDKIAYLEATYEKELEQITYQLALQYANESYRNQPNAKVYGGLVSITDNRVGVSLTTAYTKAKDNSAFSGFGGGPLFSNSEYLILDNAGEDGDALWIGVEYDASNVGLEGLTLGLGEIMLKDKAFKKSTEFDCVVGYEVSSELEVHLIASKLKAVNVGEDDAKHLRIFANYNF